MAKENYIHRLQRENAELREEKAEALEELNELYRYLQSSKFHTDTTVQVSDIFARTEALRTKLV